MYRTVVGRYDEAESLRISVACNIFGYDSVELPDVWKASRRVVKVPSGWASI